MKVTKSISVGAQYAPYPRPTPSSKHLTMVCPLDDLPEHFDPSLHTFQYSPVGAHALSSTHDRTDCQKYSALLANVAVLPDLLRLELSGAGRVMNLERLTGLTKLLELRVQGHDSYDLAAIGLLKSLWKLSLDCSVRAFSAHPTEWLAPLTNLTHLSLTQSTLHQPHFPASVLEVLAQRAVPLHVATLHIHSFPDMEFVRTTFNVHAIAVRGTICFKTGPVSELQWSRESSQAVIRCDWRVQLRRCVKPCLV